MIPHPHPLHGVGSRGFPQPRTCLTQYYDLNVIDSRFSLEEGHHVEPNRELNGLRGGLCWCLWWESTREKEADSD